MSSKAYCFNKKSNHFFNKNICHLRHELGYSQYNVADDLDVTRSCYASWEEHRSEPSFDTLIKVCEYFKVKIEDMLTIDLSKTMLNYIDKSFVQL